MSSNSLRLSRRSLLLAAGAASGAAILAPRIARAAVPAPGDAPPVHDLRLAAAPATAQILPAGQPATPVWAFNGTAPGPEIRLRQGETLRVAVENRLEEGTTVHWHGLRIPNAMDGVPDLTQPPIPPGGSFVYEFRPPDAGTFWYHPHRHSGEQVGRGLHGALIVEEPEPLPVDRELTWVLGDWRLSPDATITADFAHPIDRSHFGRLGNTVTVNGRVSGLVPVQAGERLRLRLINAANARIFALGFPGHRPLVIALDGQPVTPHEPEDGQVLLGPGMRADLLLDLTGEPGGLYAVTDRFTPERPYRVATLAYGTETPLRGHRLPAPAMLPANPLPEPDLATAQRFAVVFEGGAMMAGMMGGGMGGMMDGGAMMGGQGGTGMHAMHDHSRGWTVNGVAGGEDHAHMPPLLTLPRGQSCVLAFANETAFFHPIHLHGHHFRVLTRNGQPEPFRPWRDTVLLAPRDRVEVAFLADNPGAWMLHCHILEHQAAGMMALVRVAG